MQAPNLQEAARSPPMLKRAITMPLQVGRRSSITAFRRQSFALDNATTGFDVPNWQEAARSPASSRRRSSITAFRRQSFALDNATTGFDVPNVQEIYILVSPQCSKCARDLYISVPTDDLYISVPTVLTPTSNDLLCFTPMCSPEKVIELINL